MNKYTQPTEAVREYQRLNSLITRRINESNGPADRAFWVRLHEAKALEITAKFEVSMSELVDSWIEWTETVEAERELVRQGVSA